jgi:diguanylate cyclase (GGDEF)-like protein
MPPKPGYWRQQYRARRGRHSMAMTDTGRTAFRLSLASRETPRALVVVGACFVTITLVNAMFGAPMAMTTVILNGIVTVLLLGGAVLTRQAWWPAHATPWLAAVCALAMVTAGQVQVWLNPDGASFAYVLLIVVAYSPLTLAWAPTISVAVPMIVGCILVSRQWPSAQATDWVIASVAAVAIGMTLLGLRLRSIFEMGELSALVETMATEDELTGLLNRHGIERNIPRLVAVADRHNQFVFAVFLDVIGLKQANDMHGHDFGDHVIAAVADALKESVRGGDILGRWGGDEFLVIGAGQPEDPEALAQRVRDIIERKRSGFGPWPVQVSVGSAIVGDEHPDVHALIRQADDDMYRRRRAHRP